MQLEVGKKYLMRNGGVTGVIRRSNSTDTFYPTSDGNYYWTDEGHYYCDFTESEFDIVSEYVEPENTDSKFERMKLALNAILFCADETSNLNEDELQEMVKFIRKIAGKGLK